MSPVVYAGGVLLRSVPTLRRAVVFPDLSRTLRPDLEGRSASRWGVIDNRESFGARVAWGLRSGHVTLPTVVGEVTRVAPSLPPYEGGVVSSPDVEVPDRETRGVRTHR